MQFTIEEAAKQRVLRDSAMSIPTSLCSNKILANEFEIDSFPSGNAAESVLTGLLSKQHPLIHTWLVFSSVSICFLFVLFFIVQ